MTQAYPTSPTPRGTTGRVPITTCVPTNATVSQPKDGTTVTAPPPASGLPAGEAATGVGASLGGWSSGVGVTLITVGGLVMVAGVTLLIVAVIVLMRARIRRIPEYQ